jgi:hypothetical protein
LIRDSTIQIPNRNSKGIDQNIETLGLQDNVNNAKDSNNVFGVASDSENAADELKTSTSRCVPDLTTSTYENTEPVYDELNDLLRHTQIVKSEIDQIIAESKKLDNNLKLFFLMNMLSDEDEQQENCEKFVSKFMFKLYLLNTESSTNVYLTNCLCVITTKNIFIFNVTDRNV